MQKQMYFILQNEEKSKNDFRDDSDEHLDTSFKFDLEFHFQVLSYKDLRLDNTNTK